MTDPSDTPAPLDGAQQRPLVRIRVDATRCTGPVHGGATGLLYGLGDPGVPSAALIEGARPRTVAQRAPEGSQHPTGDSIAVADGFFAAGGQEVLVYMQDDYAEWPYEQLGIEDYLTRVRRMVARVAQRADHARFAWVPFNEPDWIWYGDWAADRERFFADWTAVVREIRALLPEARVVGPNEMRFDPQRLRDFLGWADGEGLLPDVMSWHELTPDGLRDYRGHHATYRAIEKELGIGPLPINIDEYGNRRDFSVPSRVLRWVAMFEETKVDADMAYWTFAGNLDDHAVRSTEANGGWWLLKWYADLTGETVSVGGDGAVEALAVLDEPRRQITILVPGADAPADLDVLLPRADPFGRAVDVARSTVSWTGYEGAAVQPRVVARHRTTTAGPLRIRVPGGDPLAVHRFVITPAEVAVDTPAADDRRSYLAQDATVVHTELRPQDTDPQQYAASGTRDVGPLEHPDSAVTFAVDVPDPGGWRFAIVYATGKSPSRQRLLVDGVPVADVSYPGTLTTDYRGRVELDVELSAGTHEVALRPAIGAGWPAVAIDRLEVLRPRPAAVVLGARDGRLGAGAELVSGDTLRPAVVRLAAGADVRFFLAAEESGYHDITLVALAAEAVLTLRIGDRAAVRAARPAADRETRARVHLPKGVSRIEVAVDSGALDLVALRIEPVADDGRFPWVAVPEDAVDAHGRLGALVLTADHRSAEGPLDLVLRYSNAAVRGDHEYNTDVVSARAVLRVDDVDAGVVHLGPTHSWANTAERSVPVDVAGRETIALVGLDPAPGLIAFRLLPFVRSHGFEPAAP
ncbi:CBM35 domain-containing protein [uncultured Amnibacterium sp.]|uniref:CBM35 domain-containing protein n=1 Tax=uncultured Amnibacterium sp. TaxID=1631851 RepID=UPI0035CC66A0